MRRKATIWLISILVNAAAVSQANAQCCSAGNAFTGADHSAGIAVKALAISYLSKYSRSQQYFQGHSESELGDIKHSDLLYSELSLAYGLTEQLSLRADMGYFHFKREVYKPANAETSTGMGMGDMRLGIHYSILLPAQSASLRTNLGTSIPLGVFDQEVDNVRLPLPLQPSSGSWKMNGSLVLRKAFGARKILFASMLYERSFTIRSNFFHYRYGDLLALSTGLSYRLSGKTTAVVGFRSQHSGRAIRDGEMIIESSGGDIVYLIPELGVQLFKNYNLTGSFELPLFRYYNGVQLGHQFAAQVRITRLLKLSKQQPS